MRVLALCAAVELVSQSCTGKGTATSSSLPTPMPLTVELAFDFEGMNYAMVSDTKVHMNMSGIVVDTNSTTHMIFKADAAPQPSTATVHMHVYTSSAVTGQPPQVQEHCMLTAVPQTRAPADAARCLRALAAGAKPDAARAKEGWDAYETDFNIPEPSGTAENNSTFYLDKQFLLHALVGSQTVPVPNQPAMTTVTNFDVTPTAGRPDASRFDVPAAWKCTESPLPAPPAGMKPFLDCLQAPAAAVVV